MRLCIRSSWLFAVVPTAITCAALSARALAQDDVATVLKGQTQALMDAVASGDRAVWDRYLDADMMYLAEDGTRKTKADLLKELQPLPAGITGSIVVDNFTIRAHGDVVVATHDDHERETYYGHALTAEYRTTDTWLRTPSGWKLIAGQVHAVLADPPAITLEAARLDEYVGTYRLNPEITYVIRRSGDGLTGQRGERPAQQLRVEAPDVLFVPGQPRVRKIFQRDSEGRIVAFVDRREGRDVPWERTR